MGHGLSGKQCNLSQLSKKETGFLPCRVVVRNNEIMCVRHHMPSLAHGRCSIKGRYNDHYDDDDGSSSSDDNT